MPITNDQIRKSEVIWVSALFSLVTVILCISRNINFFNIDDAVNEYLPFFTQVGRICSSGHFPFLTDCTLFGSNALVELAHAAFTPQTILASLLAWHCEHRQLPAIFLALVNFFLVGASCLLIGRLYGLRRPYAYLLASFCLIQPVFMFIYARSWHNAACAQAWFMLAIAGFLVLARRVSIRNFLLSFFSVLFLLSTAWTYAVLAYALFILAFVIYHHNKKFSSLGALFPLILPGILAGIFVIPLYSEYIYNSDLHDRFFAFYNRNFLVLPWSSELLSFMPTYLDFINWFGGYHLKHLSLSFSIIFLPIVFFNRNLLSLYKNDLNFRFISCIIILYFVCTQLPETFSSMRWPFRFVPFFTYALCFATVYALDRAELKRSSIQNYLLFLLTCLILGLSKSIGNGELAAWSQLFSLAALLLAYMIDRKNLTQAFIYPVTALCILLFFLNVTAWGFKSHLLPKPIIPKQIEFPEDFNHEGYIISLGNFSFNNAVKPHTSLYFQRGGLYNIRTINGYSPLGYRAANKFLPVKRGWFEAEGTLDALLAPLEQAGMCRANAWRISTFVLPEDIAKKNAERLEKCGYRLGREDAGPLAYASLSPGQSAGWDKLPPVALPPLPGIKHESHRDAHDSLYLPERDAPLSLVFPRLFWRGYRATLNGEKLEVKPDETGLLTSVQVPAGSAGHLEFYFFPETWRYLWICPLLAGLGLLAACLYLRRHPCQPFWPGLSAQAK